MTTMMSNEQTGARTTRATRVNRATRVGVAALAASAVLLLAACGSSSGKASSSRTSAPGTATTTPSSATTQSGKPIAMTADSKLGRVLVDANGMTVYTLMNNGKPVPCTGQCLTFWPPLLVPAGDTNTASSGVADLGTATTNAGKQVSYKGAPLYRYSMDKAPGDTNGDGINAFGGIWHVVKIGGSTTTSSPGAGVPATTPTTMSAGGYGY
jgi:predicted lipoprotein with Yx(FWY)xxD motif